MNVLAPVADHAQAVERILEWMAGGAADFEAVGHRVVHGGARFTGATPIDDAVVEAIEALEDLAPRGRDRALPRRLSAPLSSRVVDAAGATPARRERMHVTGLAARAAACRAR
jgi:Acetokinase family